MKKIITTIGLIALFTSCIKHNITVIQTNQKGDTLFNKTFDGYVSISNNVYGIYDNNHADEVISGGIISVKYND